MPPSPVELPPHKSYPLGRLPPVSFLGREPPKLTRKAHPVGEAGTKASLIAVRDAVLRGYVDPEVRAWAIKRLKDRGNPEDQVERARVLLTAIRDEKIWVPDPPNTEYVQEARLTLGEGPDKLVFDGGDCFAEGTLLLTERRGLVAVENVDVDDRIWGLDRWVRVEASVAKGVLPISLVHLTNGGVLRLTGGHHVNVMVCPRHAERDGCNNPCSCPLSERVATRLLVSDLRPEMVIPQPHKMHFEAMGVHSPMAAFRARELLNPFPRVSRIDIDAERVPCHDIQTEDHNVYLPEHDVTVLNCDDLAVATLSAYLSIAGSVGCYAAVVGHSYARDGQLSHVLGAILAPGPDGERWYYVEPSSKKVPFGESYEPTREVVFIVPGTTGDQPDCDAARCLAGSRAVRPPQQKPQFFGVSGPPPAGLLGAPGDVIPGPDGGDPNVMPVPSPIGENDKIGQWLLSLRNNLAASRENLLKAYDGLSEVADGSGRPLPSPDAPDVFNPQAGDTPGVDEPPWTVEDSAYVRTLTTASDQLLRMMDRIIQGYQPLMWVESIKNFGMRYESEDRYEIALVNDRVVLKDRGTSAVSGLGAAPAAAAPVAAAGPGLTIAIVVILAILGVAVVSTAYFIAQYNDRQAAKANAESQRRLADLYDKCLSSPNCTPAQRELIGRAFGVQSGALTPAPQPGAYGTGEGFGWSWLAWPLIGATVIAFLFSTEKVYTRQSNRSRRFRQREAREAAKQAAAQKTAKGGKYVYGQVIGTRPDGTPIIEATDAQPTPSWGQRVAGAVLGL